LNFGDSHYIFTFVAVEVKGRFKIVSLPGNGNALPDAIDKEMPRIFNRFPSGEDRFPSGEDRFPSGEDRPPLHEDR
jgi:hypothetical protein